LHCIATQGIVTSTMAAATREHESRSLCYWSWSSQQAVTAIFVGRWPISQAGPARLSTAQSRESSAAVALAVCQATRRKQWRTHYQFDGGS